jgi:hypothetical protein
VQKGMDDLRKLLNHSLDSSVEFVTVAEHVERSMSGCCR